MKSTELKIKTLEGLSIEKIGLLIALNEGKYFEDTEDISITDKIRLICDWTDLEESTVYQMSRESVEKLFNLIIDQISSYKLSAPKKKIGNLVFRTDYLKWSAGHWRHIEMIDAIKQPYQFLSLLYIEEGMDYAEKDKKGRILNPSKERIEQIKSDFTIPDFLNVMAFFLNISQMHKELLREENSVLRAALVRMSTRTNGRTLLKRWRNFIKSDSMNPQIG
jgi:hypothetical protein